MMAFLMRLQLCSSFYFFQWLAPIGNLWIASLCCDLGLIILLVCYNNKCLCEMLLMHCWISKVLLVLVQFQLFRSDALNIESVTRPMLVLRLLSHILIIVLFKIYFCRIILCYKISSYLQNWRYCKSLEKDAVTNVNSGYLSLKFILSSHTCMINKNCKIVFEFNDCMGKKKSCFK